MTEPAHGFIGVVEIARRLGALSWVSEQLFMIEGTWAHTMANPAAVVHLSTASRYHGAHVGLCRDALPDSPALDAQAHIGPPEPGWEVAVAAARELESSSDAARLSALYRSLVPRHLSLIDDLAGGLGGPGDTHIQRVLAIVRDDVVADADNGQRLLETTLGEDAASETAISAVKALDQAFRTY